MDVPTDLGSQEENQWRLSDVIAAMMANPILRIWTCSHLELGSGKAWPRPASSSRAGPTAVSKIGTMHRAANM